MNMMRWRAEGPCEPMGSMRMAWRACSMAARVCPCAARISPSSARASALLGFRSRARRSSWAREARSDAVFASTMCASVRVESRRKA